MVTKIVFTKVNPEFLEENADLDVLETFELGERYAAKVRISSDAGVQTLSALAESDDRIEGVEDSFDAHTW